MWLRRFHTGSSFSPCPSASASTSVYKSRGQRRLAASAAAPAATAQAFDIEADIAGDDDYRKRCRQRWAALIKRVYEINPLRCPKCGGQMRIISIIGRRDQAEVVERILRHCGLWDDAAPRAPPGQHEAAQEEELSYVSDDEDSRQWLE
jgi:hypothetical protein